MPILDVPPVAQSTKALVSSLYLLHKTKESLKEDLIRRRGNGFYWQKYQACKFIMLLELRYCYIMYQARWWF